MPSPNAIPYKLPALGAMPSDIDPEALKFRVPVVNEAFLVSAPPGFSSTRRELGLTIAASEIGIARTDGMPLQIDEVVAGRRRSILARPIATLALWRGEERDVLMLSEQAGVTDREAMGRFLDLIEAFTHLKQKNRTKRQEAADALRLLDMFREE